MVLRFTLFVSLFLSLGAFAAEQGVYFSESLLPYTWKSTNTPGVNSEERTFISSETGLGYVISGWIYLGGTFNYTKFNENLDQTTGITKKDRTHMLYGPSLGWIGSRLYLVGSYFLITEQKDVIENTGITSSYARTGTGFGANLGYRIPFGGFHFGPMVSFKSATFTTCKDTTSGVSSTCNPSVGFTEVTPYLVGLINFK